MYVCTTCNNVYVTAPLVRPRRLRVPAFCDPWRFPGAIGAKSVPVCGTALAPSAVGLARGGGIGDSKMEPIGTHGFWRFFQRFRTAVLHCFVVVCKRGLMEGNGTQGILRLCFCRKDFGRLALLTLR